MTDFQNIFEMFFGSDTANAVNAGDWVVCTHSGSALGDISVPAGTVVTVISPGLKLYGTLDSAGRIKDT